MDIILPTDEVTLKSLKAAIQEVVDSKTRLAAEKTLQKDAIAEIAEKYELPKEFISQMATWRYDESRKDKTVAKVESFDGAYDILYQTNVKKAD